MKAIYNNPYFILCVYANSKAKERGATFSKFRALAKFGKEISENLTFKNYLDNSSRTYESILDAHNRIEESDYCINYWFFWFFDKTENDKAAMSEVFKGNLDAAIKILEKDNSSFSAVINMVMINYLKTKQYNFKAILGMILNEKTWSQFVESFQDTYNLKQDIEKKAVISKFLDNLLSESNISKSALSNAVSELANEGYDVAPLQNLLGDQLANEYVEKLDKLCSSLRLDEKSSFNDIIETVKNKLKEGKKLNDQIKASTGESNSIYRDNNQKLVKTLKDALEMVFNLKIDFEVKQIECCQELLNEIKSLSYNNAFKLSCEQTNENFDYLKKLNDFKICAEIIKNYDEKLKSNHGYDLSSDVTEYLNNVIPLSEFLLSCVPPSEKFAVRENYYSSFVYGVLNSFSNHIEKCSKDIGDKTVGLSILFLSLPFWFSVLNFLIRGNNSRYTEPFSCDFSQYYEYEAKKGLIEGYQSILQQISKFNLNADKAFQYEPIDASLKIRQYKEEKIRKEEERKRREEERRLEQERQAKLAKQQEEQRKREEAERKKREEEERRRLAQIAKEKEEKIAAIQEANGIEIFGAVVIWFFIFGVISILVITLFS